MITRAFHRGLLTPALTFLTKLELKMFLVVPVLLIYIKLSMKMRKNFISMEKK